MRTPSKFSVIRASKYVMIGDTDSVNVVVDGFKNSKPMLADDAKFVKLTSPLKDEALGTAYVSPRVFFLVLLTTIRTRSLISTLPQPTLNGTPVAAGPTTTPSGPSPD